MEIPQKEIKDCVTQIRILLHAINEKANELLETPNQVSKRELLHVLKLLRRITPPTPMNDSYQLVQISIEYVGNILDRITEMDEENG